MWSTPYLVWRRVCLVLVTVLVCAVAPMLADAEVSTLRPNATSDCRYGINLEWTTRVGSSVVATPRIVDLVHDGTKEILVPTFSQFMEALAGGSGEDVPGFPYLHPRFKTYASPLPVDLDGDGRVEWLVAMYTGELVVFGEDGQARGVLRVPPLSVKRDWQRRNATLAQLATLRPGHTVRSPAAMESILRARYIEDLYLPPRQVSMAEPDAAMTDKVDAATRHAAPHRTPAALERQPTISTTHADVDALDNEVDWLDDWPTSDDEEGEEERSVMRVGPEGHLSPEARRSMSLLFHPELYRIVDHYATEQDIFLADHLHEPVTTAPTEDEIAVDAHLLSTPVITDVNHDGDLDIIMHVSYYFDDKQPAPRSAESGSRQESSRAADPNDYAATAVVCMSLFTGEVRWVHVLHLSTKNTSTAAFALSSPLVIAAAPSTVTVYVTSTTGHIVALDGRNGTVRAGWPRWLGPISAPPAAEDVNGDGDLDLCVGDAEGKVACYTADGAPLWQRDVIGGVAGRLTFGDVDGDGVMDVVLGTTAGLLYALRGIDGVVLPHFPIVTSGPILAPVLLVNLQSIAFGQHLHLIVPSHDGRVYIVDGMNGCVETIDIDEKSSTMVLADDVTGNGFIDLVVATLGGGVYVFETATPFHPLKRWESETKGLNGHTAGEHHVGIFIDEAHRGMRDIRGDSFVLPVTIYDERPRKARREYVVDVYVGARLRIYHGVFSEARTYSLTMPTPRQRMAASLVVVMRLSDGQVFSDSIALGFNMHYLETIKFTLLLPFVLLAVAHALVHKRHEHVEGEYMQTLL